MNRSLIIIGIFMGLTILLLAFFRNLAYNPVGTLIQHFLSPIQYQTYRLKLHFLGDENEIETLRKENAALAKKLIDQTNLKKDVEALRSQFSNSPITTSRLIPVDIVGTRGLILLPEALIIHAGSKDGIKVGMAVVYEANLVGIIKKVSEQYAEIILPTNHEFSAFAKIANSDILGVVKGEGDFILLDNVSVAENLKKGMHVVTKGEVGENGIGLMPDFIIGKVEFVNKIENRPLQNARVIPLIQYAKLKKVFVVKN